MMTMATTSLGPHLRLLRRVQGLTQWEVGQRAGLQVMIVSRIERGQRPVSPDELARLQAVLGLPASPPEPPAQ